MGFRTSSLKLDEAHKLVKIGIRALDERLKGFPNNSVILILGDPGSGFLTFLHQILQSRSAAGANILYVCLDRPKKEILWDLSTYRWSGEKWNFIDLSPMASRESTVGLSWKSDAVNLLSHDLIRKIGEEKLKQKETGVIMLDTIINSLSSMLLNSDINTVLGFINEYSMAIRDTNGLHFLTLVHGVHGQEIEQTIAHYADVVLDFRVHVRGKKYEHIMGVRKMRGAAMPPTTLFPLEFTSQGVLPVTTEQL